MSPRWPARTLQERFEEKVDRTHGECHLWTGTTVRGYGWISLGRAEERGAYAHRVAWFLATGQWPALHVLHSCDTPRCVRVEHLFLGTQLENLADMTQKGRRRSGISTGVNNGRALAPSVIEAIRTAPGTQRGVAAEFGVSQRTVGRVRRGKHWTS
jgi:hypothetical protein